MGVIFNIQRFCLHDGKGIRTNVFFKGCPLRCLWCHNPEGLSKKVSLSYNSDKCCVCGRCTEGCDARSIVDARLVFDRDKCVKCQRCVSVCLLGANELIGKEMTAEEVMGEVVRDKIYYNTSGGGMTLSGGEPSMQEDFALELISLAKREGISVTVETCGIGSRSFYEKAAWAGVSFLFDIKCMDEKKHIALTGASNRTILDNLSFLFDSAADVVIRLPLVPGVNDSAEDIGLLCDFLEENAGKYSYAEIMPYHSFGVAKAVRVLGEADFSAKDADENDKLRWTKDFSKRGIDVKISQ